MTAENTYRSRHNIYIQREREGESERKKESVYVCIHVMSTHVVSTISTRVISTRVHV